MFGPERFDSDTVSGQALTFPAADVLDIRPGPSRKELTVGLMGLTGPSGVLPRYYTELVSLTLRGGSRALHEFLDMLGERFVAFLALAAIKYRPARAVETSLRQSDAPLGAVAPDAITRVLLALAGHGTPHLTSRLAVGTEPLLHYVGLFATHPRSADRLCAMLSDWLGMKVEVVEYAGTWLSLPPDQRTRIGTSGSFCQLGVDAAVGVRVWSPEARIVLRVGPVTHEGFQRLLPDGCKLHQLVSLVRAFIGLELGFAINPILLATEIPLPQLGSSVGSPTRLGWNMWLPVSGSGIKRRSDAADAVFDADIIEAWSQAMDTAA
jgi:type VI secretion system protein ImpH